MMGGMKAVFNDSLFVQRYYERIAKQGLPLFNLQKTIREGSGLSLKEAMEKIDSALSDTWQVQANSNLPFTVSKPICDLNEIVVLERVGLGKDLIFTKIVLQNPSVIIFTFSPIIFTMVASIVQPTSLNYSFTLNIFILTIAAPLNKGAIQVANEINASALTSVETVSPIAYISTLTLTLTIVTICWTNSVISLVTQLIQILNTP